MGDRPVSQGAAGEALLGVALPIDEPADTARTAARLEETASRLASLARGVARLLPTAGWTGVAAHAADQRLLEITLALTEERSRLLRAAEALTLFSHRVAAAQHSAGQARDLLAAAYQAQQAADRVDAAAGLRTANHWSGPRTDGDIFDPSAQRLLDQARRQAHTARTCYDSAAREVADELTALSGRRIARAGLTPRVLLDVAGFVPVVGDAVDAANAAVYFWQRRWKDGIVTAAASVPGPEGWVAGGLHAGKAVERAGDVEKVVDDLPPTERAAQILSGLTERGIRKQTRVLPSDEVIERLYREQLAPLGVTRTIEAPGGTVWVTRFDSGAEISFRGFSDSGGPAIEIARIKGLQFKLIHRG
jgi:hypothetical protein